jgi:hypothetical protein
MYARRSGVPQPVRVARWSRLAYGLFPGLRLIATSSPRDGAPAAVLGLVTLGLAIGLATRWGVVADSLSRIGARPSVQLVQAALIWLLVLAFEFLRLGSALPERTRSEVAPRALAALWIPTLLVAVGAPAVVPLAPDWMEPAVAAAAVVWWGSTPAVLYCSLDVVMPPSSARRRFEQVGLRAFVALTLAVLLYLFVVPHPGWAEELRELGFVVLPDWIA